MKHIDKWKHFGVGAAIGLVALLNVQAAIILGLAAAIGKEVYDQYKYGGFDIYDAYATFAGTLIMILVLSWVV